MSPTRYPGAVWKPLATGNYSIGGVVRPPRGMVLHIAEGTSIDGVWNWQNGQHQVSSYFIVAKDGTVWQAVDLANKAWTQAAGNAEWIGVENCGFHTDPLTPAQVEANAGILAWLHTNHAVPLQPTDDPTNGRGLGWHGMGGTAWGGHFGCPGDQIKSQRALILDRARILSGSPTPHPNPSPSPTEQDDLMLLVKGDQPAVYRVRNDRTSKVWIKNEDILTIDKTLQNQLGMRSEVIQWNQQYLDTIPIVGPKPAGYTGV